MGLTGTHSWNADSNASTVQRYDANGNAKSAFIYNGMWRFILVGQRLNANTNHVFFTVKTDTSGCSTLQFSCSGAREGSSDPPRVFWKIQTSRSLDTSGMTEASYNGSTWSGTINTTRMLPNTTYYIHFYSTFGSDASHTNSLHGTMTITGSGTYGAPGNITANNTNFDSPINMSYASATSGGSYTVKVKVGSSAEVTLQTQSSTSSRSWTPSLATYGPSYPNQASVNCVITVDTYFGGVLSGTKTKTVTISFTAAQAGPSTNNAFSIAPYNTGAVAGMSGYIQRYSKIRASFNSLNVITQYGASISKWTVKFGSAAAVDVAAGTATEDSGIISAVTTVVCTVTDSRGFTASETYTATITPYQQPTLTANVFRCDSEGVSADDGTYISVSCAALYADIAGQNTMIVQAYAKLRRSSTWGSAVTITGGSTEQTGTNDTYTASGFLISGFSDAVWDVKIVATDALGNTATIEIIIESQAWALHIRNGGAGAAFGKAAEADKQLQIPDDWDYYKGLNKAVLSAYPVGSIYMSVNSTSPADLFGGTWERITGKFLLAATDGGSSGASQAAGNTGGSATMAHTHTHAHTHNLSNNGYAKFTPWSDNIMRYYEVSGKPSWTNNYKFNGSGYASGSAKASTYGIGLGGSTDGVSATNTGAASNTDNMPPFLSVYIWKRTA